MAGNDGAGDAANHRTRNCTGRGADAWKYRAGNGARRRTHGSAGGSAGNHMVGAWITCCAATKRKAARDSGGNQ